MKLSIEEIMRYRNNTHCFLIYDVEGDFYVIQGSFYKKLIGGPLYEALIEFDKGNVKWNFVSKRIVRDRDEDYKREKPEWAYIDKAIKEFVLDIDNLYRDGELQELTTYNI